MFYNMIGKSKENRAHVFYLYICHMRSMMKWRGGVWNITPKKGMGTDTSTLKKYYTQSNM